MQNGLVFYDGYEVPGIRFAIPDPRWIGYLPYSFALSIHAQPTLVYGYDYKKNGYETQISQDTLDGQECWKVVFPSPLNSGKSVFTIWVDKNASERIVRVECHAPTQNIDYLDRLDVQGEVVQGKYWFPTRTVFQRLENGKVTRSSETTITILSLNEPLPVDTFSPKSIVKPDTPVMWALDRDRPVPEGSLIWDGNAVVAEDAFGKMMAETVRFKPINMFFMLLGVALILFGIGLKLWKKYGT
jgi:hypothetical protein